MQGQERAALRTEREMRHQPKQPVDYPPELLNEWRQEQQRLKASLILRDDMEWSPCMQPGHPSGGTTQSTTSVVVGPKKKQHTTPSAPTQGSWSRHLFESQPAPGASTGAHPREEDADAGGMSEKPATPAPLRLVGGVDLSFFRDDKRTAIAGLVVCAFPSLEVVYELYRVVELTAPYIPGYLAFREVPALINLIDHVRKNKPEYLPQLLLVDGNGVLHYGGFGSACHLGVLSGIPTIGVAKKLLCVDGLQSEVDVERWINQCQQYSKEWTEIRGKSGQVHGAMILKKTGGSRAEPPTPLFVSVGHRISLETAIHITLACVKHTMPEPIDQADLRSRAHVRTLNREWKEKGMTAPVYGLKLEKIHNSRPTSPAASNTPPDRAKSSKSKQRNARLRP